MQSALLEEQKSVMNKCGEERRRLAAEWAEYFTQQKLSKERAEREAERALHADSQREGTIISLTKVGLRASVALPHSCVQMIPDLGNKSTQLDMARNWSSSQYPR